MCQMCINLGAFHRILDSSDVVMSKNQKKRARKKLKKAEEVTGESACGAGRETGEGVRVCAEEKPAVRDPVAELKLKLSEAKANQVTHTRVCTCKHTCSLCLSLSLSHTHTHTHTHTGSRSSTAVEGGVMDSERRGSTQVWPVVYVYTYTHMQDIVQPS